VVDAKGDLDTQVGAVIALGEQYEVAGYVLGLPLNMDGTAGNQAEVTRRFGAALARKSGKPVHEWDERLSSAGADTYLAGHELTRKKRRSRRDAVAAQIILQSFLDGRKTGDRADRT
jgi:putative Holliday junction resolvase